MAVFLKNALWFDEEAGSLKATNILVGEGDEPLAFPRKLPESVPGEKSPEIFDCEGRLVLHGFAVGHHHAYSALARGMPPPSRPPRNFAQILELIWWRLDKALDAEIIEVSALATALEAALSGTTFIIDHHASPRAVAGSLEIIARAFARVGVGHLLCYELSDRDGPESAAAGLEETRAWLQAGNQGLVGLHASFTVGDALLEQAVALAKEFQTGLHLHVAEDPVDQEYCLKEHGLRVVERLQRFAALSSSKTILAHCLHLNDRERELVAWSPVWVAQNPASNLNNKVGRFTARGLNPERILLGTDGMHGDPLRSARLAYLLAERDEALSPGEAWKRLRRVHTYLKSGGFVGDGANNLVILDYRAPTPLAAENFSGHFAYGFHSGMVHSVISRGRFIVRNGEPVLVNRGEILARAREQAARLWRRMEEI
jgi:cytosine/adenosine deaminase-related metal-dependent hydrolase